MGTVTIQINNDRPYSVRSNYPIGLSPEALHFPDPVVSNSFANNWANTSYTARNSTSPQYINVPIERRYARLAAASLSSATRNVLAGLVFARPRI
jgi:hypothetical protein